MPKTQSATSTSPQDRIYQPRGLTASSDRPSPSQHPPISSFFPPAPAASSGKPAPAPRTSHLNSASPSKRPQDDHTRLCDQSTAPAEDQPSGQADAADYLPQNSRRQARSTPTQPAPPDLAKQAI
ncbi:hypothetical protein K470DRAFT_262792 [Piedraia hortae CBS 480.64]|uniref:Uncharacterized protein n=1 Tax=Piedraia hortae CBS 480.64 TaxID=1314780 RepID=A0A6A7C4Q1_9PEZI|nr:hypothetical protein K470DRAFT_262792 [Piedraia hortae CBS 480.64]